MGLRNDIKTWGAAHMLGYDAPLGARFNKLNDKNEKIQQVKIFIDIDDSAAVGKWIKRTAILQ